MVFAGHFVDKRYIVLAVVAVLLALAAITFLAMHISMAAVHHMAVFNRRGPIVAFLPHVFNRR